MCRDDAAGCWWITLNNLNPAKEYAFQYYVGTKGGETIRLADAYCEKILDPEHDDDIPASAYPDNKTYPKGGKGIVSVFKIQRDNYAWTVSDFKMQHPKQPVIYEMHLRDFTTGRTINSALQKLDYLKNMGVDAIELMPVQEFDGTTAGDTTRVSSSPSIRRMAPQKCIKTSLTPATAKAWPSFSM